MKNSDFISIAELAKMLGMTRMGVFKRIKSGKLKAKKIGRAFYIARKDLTFILGAEVGAQERKDIGRAVSKAVNQYGETFRLLGRE